MIAMGAAICARAKDDFETLTEQISRLEINLAKLDDYIAKLTQARAQDVERLDRLRKFHRESEELFVGVSSLR